MVWISLTALNSDDVSAGSIAGDGCEGADWLTDGCSEGVGDWVTFGCGTSLFKDGCFISTGSGASVFFKMPVVSGFKIFVGLSTFLSWEISSVVSLVLSFDAADTEANTVDGFTSGLGCVLGGVTSIFVSVLLGSVLG